MTENEEVEKVDIILKRIITDACDNAMTRNKNRENGRDRIFWWNAEIAELRSRCGMWRRRLTRAKSRHPERVAQLAGELKVTRKELRKSISKAKREAWDEMLEGLNRDPWGRPYKGVMNKMKTGNNNICQKMQGDELGRILDE